MGTPRDAAKTLRKTHWNSDGGTRTPLPVDPFRMAEDLGIKVHKVPLDKNTAGFIVKPDENAPVTIYLNSQDAPVRQRFTLAHELGHYMRHQNDAKMGYVDHRDELSSTGKDPDEIWSNSFAAELLMPSSSVLRRWADGETLASLARLYNVSKKAMEYRLINLGLIA